MFSEKLKHNTGGLNIVLSKTHTHCIPVGINMAP